MRYANCMLYVSVARTQFATREAQMAASLPSHMSAIVNWVAASNRMAGQRKPRRSTRIPTKGARRKVAFVIDGTAQHHTVGRLT